MSTDRPSISHRPFEPGTSTRAGRLEGLLRLADPFLHFRNVLEGLGQLEIAKRAPEVLLLIGFDALGQVLAVPRFGNRFLRLRFDVGVTALGGIHFGVIGLACRLGRRLLVRQFDPGDPNTARDSQRLSRV